MNTTQKARTRKVLCAAVLLMIVLAAVRPVAAFAADNPLKLTVRQLFEASPASADDTFSYRLRPLEAGNPMPAGESSAAEGYVFAIAGTADKEIGPIGFSRPGIYRYELRQVSEKKPGYIYDERVYTIEAYADRALCVEVIIKNADGTKARALEFKNVYAALPTDPALMVDPPVRKTVTGNPKSSGVFTFKLEARAPSNPMPAGSVNGVKMVRITGAGEGEFGTWSYDKPGVYFYTVSEVNAGQAGYTYDNAVYTIADTVTAEDGRLVLSRVVTNTQNKPVAALDYINQYSEGKDGPKTGDEMDKLFFIIIFAAGSVLAVGAAIFLIAGRKRKGIK